MFNAYGVSVVQDQRALEMDSGDSCSTVCMYSTPPTCTLLNGEDCKFYIVFYTHTHTHLKGRKKSLE